MTRYNSMKNILLFLAGMVVGVIGMYNDPSFKRQEIIVAYPQAQGGELPTLPPITLQTVIDTLTVFDIVHESRLMTYMGYYGLTDPNTMTIYINDRSSLSERKDTVIHEMLHVAYRASGGKANPDLVEEAIRTKSHELYLQLYPNAGQ